MMRILRWGMIFFGIALFGYVLNPASSQSRPVPASKAHAADSFNGGSGKDCSHAMYSALNPGGYPRGRKGYIKTDYKYTAQSEKYPQGLFYGQITLSKKVALCSRGYVRRRIVDKPVPAWIGSRVLIAHDCHQVPIGGGNTADKCKWRSYRFHPTGKPGVFETKRFPNPFANDKLTVFLEAVGRFRHRR